MSRKQRLLELNALLVAIALVGAIAVGTGAIVIALVRETPLLSDPQKQEIVSIALKHPILLGTAAGWVLGSMITQVRRQIRRYQRATENAALAERGQQWARQNRGTMLQGGEIEIERRGEKTSRTPVSPQCRNCQYLSREIQACVLLSYPCAIHPYGPNSESCPDWQAMEECSDK